MTLIEKYQEKKIIELLGDNSFQVIREMSTKLGVDSVTFLCALILLCEESPDMIIKQLTKED